MLHYPDLMLPRLRYQFCPMGRTQLHRRVINDDGIERVCCPNCGWVHFPANAMGVNVVVSVDGGIVALLPPGEPEEAPAALPGGHVEYGESPEEAVVREAREETGLDVEITAFLGWHFERNPGYPGPMVSFMFATRAVGGRLVGSEEGRVRVYSLSDFPAISPNRKGSRRTMEAFLDYLRR